LHRSEAGRSADHLFIIVRGDALAGVVGVDGDMENVSQAL
jgi:hypothetical protein